MIRMDGDVLRCRRANDPMHAADKSAVSLAAVSGDAA